MLMHPGFVLNFNAHSVIGDQIAVLLHSFFQLVVDGGCIVGKMIDYFLCYIRYSTQLFKSFYDPLDIIQTHVGTFVGNGNIDIGAIQSNQVEHLAVLFNKVKYFFIEIAGIVGIKDRLVPLNDVKKGVVTNMMPCRQGRHPIFAKCDGIKGI